MSVLVSRKEQIIPQGVHSKTAAG